MSDLDRRLLIGAAGLAGVAAISKFAQAGPLTPASGPVASTGRTLDEIYNRIPAPGVAPVGAFDGRTPIAGSTSAVTINQPGNYVLTGNILVNGPAINFEGNDITLDLNGYAIGNTTSFLSAAQFQTESSNITLRNGTFFGGNPTLAGSSALTNLLLENLTFRNTRLTGVALSSILNRAVHIRNCRFVDIGGGTVSSDFNAIITAAIISGGLINIEQCSVSRFRYNGTGTQNFRGLRLDTPSTSGGVGNIVSRCTVATDRPTATDGINIQGLGVYRDNTVFGFSLPYVGSTNGGGNA